MLVPWLLPLVASQCVDESSLLRLPTWRSARDLASVSPSEPLKLSEALQLQVLAVVPSFGKEAYVTLLHGKVPLKKVQDGRSDLMDISYDMSIYHI